MDEWTSLAVAARDGDSAAMRSLIRLTQPQVWRLCAHLGDPDNADDLTQETYLRAFRALPTYRGESPVRVWLFTIARRAVADDIAQRQRRRRAQAEVRPAMPIASDHADSVLTRELIAGLDAERREAFVLTQVFGYPYAEAAAICGCPVGTIRSRVARAREQLVGMLDRRDGATEQTA